MTSVKDGFFADTSSFVNNHKILCSLTLGVAVVVYAIGNLAGRAVSWISVCCGASKKIDTVARERLSSVIDSAELAKPINAVIPQKVDGVKASFSTFIVELEKEILPLYENHEKGFDQPRIHGRLHVARAVIFGEVMARYYQNKGVSVDFDYARRTIGLHDAGREGNGVDHWEKESSDLLRQHLILKNMPQEEAAQKSNIIIKEKANKDSTEFKIFQSADCLDIMRPCTENGGREGFNPKYLTFLKNSETESDEFQFRERLIEEAWLFIQLTEDQKMTEFNENEGFMEKLFLVIKEHQDKLPILSSIL